MRWMLMGLLLVVVGCGSVAVMEERVPGRSQDAVSSPASFTAMSFNIRFGTANDGANAWEHRREAVMGMIRRHDPDLLGVQEALTFQVEEIKAAFPGYAFWGVGRDDGLEAGEYCGIFVKRERFGIEEGGHLWLSEDPERPGSVGWDASMTRMASWVLVRARRSGRAVVFGNTHFDHIGAESRLASARLIRDRLVEVPSGTAFVLVGDFNAGEGSPPYLALTTGDLPGNPALVDAYRQAHPERREGEGTYSAFRAEAVRDRRIDWVLHNPVLETVDCVIDYGLVDGVLASDHDPVVAELRWAE
ncbi:endonuclease/exonuclease/phosphatase family protein [Mucisphaera sp.]|uniref:endonuclease/exonuclease/phosphatase family protein n=1 Tax=Mucisphaera sp. TaxID=2913024 RepID=UPI003D0E47FC